MYIFSCTYVDKRSLGITTESMLNYNYKKKKKILSENKLRKYLYSIDHNYLFIFSFFVNGLSNIVSFKKIVFLHFWYLYLVRIVLPAKVVPRSRPSSCRRPLCLVFAQHARCLAHFVVIERL